MKKRDQLAIVGDDSFLTRCPLMKLMIKDRHAYEDFKTGNNLYYIIFSFILLFMFLRLQSSVFLDQITLPWLPGSVTSPPQI